MQKLKEKRKRITRFPFYIIQNVPTDDPTLPNVPESEAKILASVYAADQFFDFVEGLAFAEEYFLKRDIKEFSVDELRTFITALQKIIGRSTELVEGTGCISGKMAERNSVIGKETGRNDPPTYEGHNVLLQPYSEKNMLLVQKDHGPLAAEHYKNFGILLQKIQQQKIQEICSERNLSLVEKMFCIHNINIHALILLPPLREHPGRRYFLDTVEYINHSAKTLTSFDVFCQILWEHIQQEADPLAIAAYALGLGRRQVFGSVNGRLSRLLSNCILMQYGYYPINWLPYYRLLQAFMQEKFCQEPISITIDILQKEVPTDPQSLKPALPEIPRACYRVTGSTLVMVKGKQGIYLLNIENHDAYISALPNRNELIMQPDKINYLEHELPALLPFHVLRMNAAEFYYRAELNRKYCPDLSIYYYARAAELFEQKRELMLANKCYLALVELCYQLENFGACNDYVLKALTHVPNQSRGLLESRHKELEFIEAYRQTRILPAICLQNLVVSTNQNKEERKWANQAEKDLYFPYLEKFSSAFAGFSIRTSLPDKKYAEHLSPSGWQLYAIKNTPKFLAVLNIFNRNDAEKLGMLLQRPPCAFEVKPLTKGSITFIGIYISDVATLAKQVEQLPQLLEQEYKRNSVETKVVLSKQLP